MGIEISDQQSRGKWFSVVRTALGDSCGAQVIAEGNSEIVSHLAGLWWLISASAGARATCPASKNISSVSYPDFYLDWAPQPYNSKSH